MSEVIKGNWMTREVSIGDRKLDPSRSQKIWNHSPDGFNWGYGGSGPAQLALALLLEFTDEETARKNYQNFKWEIISPLPHKNFEMPVELVKHWLAKRSKA